MLAQDTLLDRKVALKRLSTATDVRSVSRLRREALVGASLSHPNLVSIYDVITCDDGAVVIVMEYVPGETLRDRIKRYGGLPVPDALRILGGVGSALDAIHRRGIVHRDVKPANVLLGPSDTVKLADLGIAALPDHTRITTAGTVLGSFAYMAPEQLEDGPVTPAIDVYALAAVAFEALSGRKAREEKTPLAVAHAVATRPAPDLRTAWPAAPPAAAEVLKRAMSRDPRRRPPSAGELIGRLRAALVPERTRRIPAASLASIRSPATAVTRVNRSPAAPPPRPPATTRAPARALQPAQQRSRRRWLVAVGPLALVAAALAAVLVATSSPSSRQRPSASQRADRGATAAHRAGGGGRGAPAAAAGAHSSGAASSPANGAEGQTAPPTTSGGASANSAAAASPTTARAGVAGGVGQTGPAAGSPVAAVESFYTLAAAHDYPAAWDLADQSFRSQLGGYRSFEGGMAGDRSITFDSARVADQTTTTATVAITTTSVRNDGTQHCGGTVDLDREGGTGGWLLHLININCG